MRILGLKLVALFYLGAGGALGELLRGATGGKLPRWATDRPGFLVVTCLLNIVALWCIAALWRQRGSTPSLHSMGKPLELLTFNFRSNTRVAFLLFSIAWVIGVIVGLFLSP